MAEPEPVAAEAKRRRTEPSGVQRDELASLQHQLASLRLRIRTLVGHRRYFEALPTQIPVDIVEQLRCCLEAWMRLASGKMSLEQSGMSESERSAEALPWLAEAEASGRWFTWQESQEFEQRMVSLMKQIEAAGGDKGFAQFEGADDDYGDDDEEKEEDGGACDPEVKAEFLRLAKARQRALWREVRRLSSLKKGIDFSGMMDERVRAAEVEKLRQQDAGDPRGAREQEALARTIDFDAKMGGVYHNSICFLVDLTTFDPMEESCSDVGFPILVYGTVVARDCIDYKRVYLFRRDSDHPQLINSEKEALILTGPKRALTLTYSVDFVETDLWVKDHQGHCRQFSKGFVCIPGTESQSCDKGEAERVSIATRLSTVDVTYDVIFRALEASIAVRVIQGEFYGSMEAHTSSSSRRILLYDSSKVAGGSCHGVIQLLRTAVSVSVKDKLIILAKNDAGACRDVQFTPRCRVENGFWDLLHRKS
ncbi:hypothetical protein BS78_09G002100 [Paspalum vaginatum]|nr:hypothetical protein BS78_09G002100 [Paspalum vaginatum]